MRIRTLLLLLSLPVLFGGCSCQRRDETTTSPTDQANAGDAASSSAPLTADAAIDGGNSASTSADLNARSAAASTLHAYLAALASGERERSDGYWSGGKPPPQPDDAIVRELGALASLRIENDTPRPLDKESPTRSLEVPVRLRAETDAGLRKFEGWYRLRAKIGGDGWEITGASLHPASG